MNRWIFKMFQAQSTQAAFRSTSGCVFEQFLHVAWSLFNSWFAGAFRRTPSDFPLPLDWGMLLREVLCAEKAVWSQSLWSCSVWGQSFFSFPRFPFHKLNLKAAAAAICKHERNSAVLSVLPGGRMGSNSTTSKKSLLCFNFCFLASYFEHKSRYCSVAVFKSLTSEAF